MNHSAMLFISSMTLILALTTTQGHGCLHPDKFNVSVFAKYFTKLLNFHTGFVTIKCKFSKRSTSDIGTISIQKSSC